MKECPKCGVWMLEVDPRNEIEKCYNCGYERKIANMREYCFREDVTYKLFIFSGPRAKPDEVFHFQLSSGVFTGEKAASLEELVNKVKKVDFESLKFHFLRGDFERWIADVLRDSKLAEQIRELREQNHVDSTLRDQLYKTILSCSIK